MSVLQAAGWGTLAVAWAAACVWLAWGYPRVVGAVDCAGRLEAELAEVESAAAKVVAINEVLHDVEHVLSSRSGWPRSASWLVVLGNAVVLAGHFLVGCFELMLALSLVCCAIVILALLGCRRAKRRGDDAAKQTRLRVDADVQQQVGDLYFAEIVLPTRRRRR